MSKLAFEIPAAAIEAELNKDYSGFEVKGLVFYEQDPLTRIFRVDAWLYDSDNDVYRSEEISDNVKPIRFYRNAPGSTLINVEINTKTPDGQLELKFSELQFWFNTVDYVIFMKPDLELLLGDPKPDGIIFSGASLNTGFGFRSFADKNGTLRPFPTLKAERFVAPEEYPEQVALLQTQTIEYTAYAQPCPPRCPER